MIQPHTIPVKRTYETMSEYFELLSTYVSMGLITEEQECEAIEEAKFREQDVTVEDKILAELMGVS